MNFKSAINRLSLIIALLLLVAMAAGAGELRITGMTCDYRTNPMGVDGAGPQLSWLLEPGERGRKQTAYQIQVASSAALLAKNTGDLWDCGKVSSDQSIQISYGGKPLVSFARSFWKVRVWDGEGVVSEWSPQAEWTMGVLDEKDWHARWIGAPDTELPSMLLRREFVVQPELKRALAYVCGLGQYELSVNGAKSGEDLLLPGWTKYEKTCLYDVHDVTRMLKPGANAIGLVLGNGMYRVPGGRYAKFKGSVGPLKAIAQLRLEYADGSVSIVGSDSQWSLNPGPLTFTCVYGGEDFDARKNPVGWDKPGFDSAGWVAAVEMLGPGGVLRGSSVAAPPMRAIESIVPVRRNPLTHGVTVYDLGQNASIMPRIQVKGQAGAVVRLTPAELLKADGSVDRVSVGRGQSYWQYTLAGRGTESWFPKFHYQGCRYLQVECLPAANGEELPVVEKLEGVVVHTSSSPAGDFLCSNELFNRIRSLVRWAQRSNLVSVISDCPHRERLGWLEQYHLNGPSLRYEFNLDQLFSKTLMDMRDSQLASGMVPSIAPEFTVFGKGPSDESNAFRNSPEWGSALVLVPWQQYEFSGDISLLRGYFEDMKRYVAYLDSRAKANILSFGLGDWYDIGPKPPGPAQLTPKELTATAFYYYDTWVLAQAARLLGKQDEARRFAVKAAEIRTAFNARFYDAGKRSYSTGSQCANAIPLVMKICEEANRAAVLDAIVADVRAHGNAITAGDVGYRYLLRALADGGRSDVVYAMNNQSEKPGYGYQLKMGATSLTEAWDARAASSQNHFMLGQIIEWFYRDLVGIQCDPTGWGFKKIIFKPTLAGDLTWVKGHYDSIYGRISSSWKRDDGAFTFDVVIPPNTTATVFIPTNKASSVTEGGKSMDAVSGVKYLRFENDAAVFAVESGTYQFQSVPPGITP